MNATLHQLPDWYYTWFKDWSPILVSIAQVVLAAVLAWLTAKLWQATRDYSNQVAIQTRIMTRNADLAEETLKTTERNKKTEALIKELDYLVGPLYSRLEDVNIFKNNDTEPSISDRIRGSVKQGANDKVYDRALFWQEIKQYKYLGSPDTDFYLVLSDYLDMLFGSKEIEITIKKSKRETLKEMVKSRYDKIRRELLELDGKNVQDKA